MVEGGRLEIVLAVLSRYVGSNPTFSANLIHNSLDFYGFPWLFKLQKIDKGESEGSPLLLYFINLCIKWNLLVLGRRK